MSPYSEVCVCVRVVHVAAAHVYCGTALKLKRAT